MKKINGKYIASATENKRAAAHTRAIARKADYDGSIECLFDPENGKFHFFEHIGIGGYIDSSDYVFVASAKCYQNY